MKELRSNTMLYVQMHKHHSLKMQNEWNNKKERTFLYFYAARNGSSR